MWLSFVHVWTFGGCGSLFYWYTIMHMREREIKVRFLEGVGGWVERQDDERKKGKERYICNEMK